ncbi:MAG: DUF975 family protein [Bacilli bacterium]|nr:DUF975 family protein [Bacilli bacterium]
MPNKTKKNVAKEAKPVKAEAAPVKEVAPKKGPTPTKMRARDYRHKAIDIVKPMSGDFAVTYLVYSVIIGAFSAIAGALALIDPMKFDPATQTFSGSGVGMAISSALIALFTILTTGAFTYSLINLSRQARAKKKPTVGGIFYGFKERYTQSLGVYVMQTIFTALWTLLLIIPGIIKSFSYSMALYIALDNPNKTTLDCITESRKLMNGNKWKLFCLRISYIGWFILMILTLGILGFWVLPKFNQAQYEFYLHITHKD